MAGVSKCKGVLFFASVVWVCVCVRAGGLFRNGASVPLVEIFRLFCSEGLPVEDLFD